ncbi:contractile injection system protein, VgrG/Pvc8 family [Collimonas pratensis]|uniref:Phage late control gene D family protein n=1 Tax=Collimonas pratensis TaxID=279113 RepID=A0ABN4MAZ0_9BURK|nr:contractile injection system protein, VgrG/Pvc8 family [Collimonas pratensis]AMP13399.1 phage late control gene D family protein [Collimonas pratensis]
MDYPIPAFKITLDGLDITAKFAPRLVSLDLTECRSDSADELNITLSDTDGQLALPSKGARINVQIGWQASGLVDKGVFTVDEIEHSGTPDVLTLRARTASLIDTFRQPVERSFHDTTLGAVIEVIAFQQELKAGIAEALRGVKIAHLDQTRESDAAFLRRLGKKYDAAATVKNDTLLFMPAGRSKTASGRDLPVIQITRNLGDRHRYHSAERDSYSGVRVFWHDDRHGLRRSVVAGAPGNSKRLRTTYANEADARTAAVAEWQRIQRGAATLELSLAIGDPALIPQSPVEVVGFKTDIDNQDWLTAKVRHSLSDAGLTTSIELETRTEEAEVEREDQADPDPGITGVVAKWRDKVSKKQGEQLAGSRSHPKTLPHIYTSKQSAVRSAKLEWVKIQERREIIAENREGE